MTKQANPTQSDAAAREVAFEDFVAGRLTLLVVRNQLDTQIAGLRSQLAIAEQQLRDTEDLLRRADEKMAAQHPEALALLTSDAGPGRKG
jgi:hypothetical protein